MLNLTEIFDSIWEALAKGRIHARDAFHTPTVGTVRGGQPEARTVVLRHVDSKAGILGFHTDRRSPKVQDLTAGSALAWHFYDRERKVQIRARGSGLVHTDDEIADEAWGEVAPLGRRCYGQIKGPGVSSTDPQVSLPSLEALEAEEFSVVAECRENFCVIRSRLTEIDWFYLEFQGHRRARFTRTQSDWQSMWVAP